MELPDRFIISPAFQKGYLLVLFLLVDLVILYFPLRVAVYARLAPRRRILFEVLYFCSILLVMEGAVAVFERVKPELFLPEARRFWTLNPGFDATPTEGLFSKTPIRISSAGLRSDEVPARKGDEVRVLLLGDSCPFGEFVRVEEAFSSVLEGLLRQSAGGRAVRVINAAVPGYSTYQGLDVYERVGAAFSPDLLVVAFNNDSMLESMEDKSRAAGPFVQSALSVLYRIRLYRFLRKSVTALSQARANPSASLPPLVPRVSEEDLKGNLRTFIGRARARGTKVLIVGLPLARATPGRRFLSFENPRGAERYRRVMDATARAEGAFFVDTMPQWEKEKMDNHLLDFCHPDAYGHRKVGEIIARFIEERKILR